MQLIKTIQAGIPKGGALLDRDSAIALGFFDGVHLGHRAVLRYAAAQGAQGLAPAAFSFSADRLAPAGKPRQRIYSDAQRADLLFSVGIQAVILPPFEEIAGMDAREFVQLLCVRLRARIVCCGDDYHFSKGASADAARLRELCAGYGTRVEVIPPVDKLGGRISSTRIRALLAQGDVDKANALLGARYTIQGIVQPGKSLGRKIGVPTVNLMFSKNLLVPRYGVYASFTRIGGMAYPSITNIGIKPTVTQEGTPNAETFIEGFAGDLYGRQVAVELTAFVRPEKKFDSLQALTEQISIDRVCADKLRGSP